jgi:hypothetical protein
VPLADWLRRPGVEYGELPATVNPAVVGERLRRHRQGRVNDKLFLWNLLAYQQFAQRLTPARTGGTA